MFAIPSRFVLSNRGRLSRRIVFWVFASVIVIETIILIPSFKNREKELLAQLKEVSTAKISFSRAKFQRLQYRGFFRFFQIYRVPGLSNPDGLSLSGAGALYGGTLGQ